MTRRTPTHFHAGNLSLLARGVIAEWARAYAVLSRGDWRFSFSIGRATYPGNDQKNQGYDQSRDGIIHI